ncbi:MAG: ABC transporter permease [Hyphomicrobiales bacterium]|nr:MAG: ABC transporter permease [Hyphomicrobiales bacterium]
MTTKAATPDLKQGKEGAGRGLLKVLGLSAGLGVILVLLLLIFIMPSLKSGPHDLALGTVAAQADVTALQSAMDKAAPGSFALVPYASEEELTDAIKARQVKGGIVLDADGAEVLVASAGSSPIAASITAVGQALGTQLGRPVTVTDLVPLPAADPTGVGIGGLAFPLVFGGIVPVVAFRKVFPQSRGWALGGIAAFAVAGGIIVSALLTFVFGSVAVAAFWPVAGAVGLGIAALALPLAGLQEVFGGTGFTLGAMVMMFLGNPLAGIATTGAWLPAGWGDFGQILPPGAAGTLVRSTAYFGGAGGMTANLTLAAWVVAGVALCLIAALRAPRPVPAA